jgi:DNA-binding IclR family transcriptional regulator
VGGHQAGIDSIETGMRLLTALAERRTPQMLKTLAADAGMPPAKAHRYMVSFVRAGYVDREPLSGLYRLGPASLQLGLTALGGTDALKLATQAMCELRDELNQTMAMIVWGNRGATIVRIEEVSQPVSINSRAGTVLPLLASASGQVFAAFLPAQMVTPMLAAEVATNRKMDDPRLVTSIDKANLILKEVRRRGIGRVTGETTPGIHALAVPVFDYRRQPVVALAAMGLGGQFDSKWNGPIAQRLKEAARTLSSRLGFEDESRRNTLKVVAKLHRLENPRISQTISAATRDRR